MTRINKARAVPVPFAIWINKILMIVQLVLQPTGVMYATLHLMRLILWVLFGHFCHSRGERKLPNGILQMKSNAFRGFWSRREVFNRNARIRLSAAYGRCQTRLEFCENVKGVWRNCELFNFFVRNCGKKIKFIVTRNLFWLGNSLIQSAVGFTITIASCNPNCSFTTSFWTTKTTF